jgi:PAS domain S-box-containing protein
MDSIVKIIFLFLISLSFLFGQEKKDALETVTLQLQWKHQFEFAGFYAAKEKGFYRDVGLDVEFREYQSGLSIVDEVIDKRADFGLSYASLLIDYMQGKPVVLLANFFKQSPLVLVVQKTIETPADLKGKRVMGLLDSTHYQTLLLMLKKFDITQDDFQNIPRDFNLQEFLAKKVDAVSVFTTNEIYALDKAGAQYNIFDPAAYGIKSYDLNLFTTQEQIDLDPKRVKDFKEASIRGWEYALEHKQEIVDLIYQKYNTQQKSKEALLFEAKQIEYLMLTQVYPIGSIEKQKVELIRDGFVQAEFIENKNKRTLDDLFYKQNTALYLTKEQKEYLAQKKRLRMCVDPNWMPIEKIENGLYIGVGSDLMKEIEKELRISLELVPTKKWADSLQKAKKRECDLIALAAKTPKRSEYLDFTTPFLQMPIVLVTKTGQVFVDSLENLKGKKLGVVRDYSFKELLENRYPSLELMEAESIQEGLSWVQRGKIYGFLDNSIVLNHEIHKNGLNDLSITGQFKESISLGIATRDDEKILHEIVQNALDSIEADTKEQILNRWVTINYTTKTDYKLIVQLLFFAFSIFGVFLYWMIKLKEEIRNKEIVKQQLRESEEKFRTLFDIAPVLLNSFDKYGNILLWNQECQRVFGWSFEELQKSKNPLELFYPEQQDRERFDTLLESQKHNTYQEWHPLTKEGKKIITMWANIKLQNKEIISIGYDVTKQRQDTRALEQKSQELKEAKEALENLNMTLEERIKDEIAKNAKHQLLLMQQNRLAQMGEMIENIAHQWRQPLSQINSIVLLMDVTLKKEQLKDAQSIEEKLLEIESLTQYMSKTIDDFKNFFNPEKQEREFYFYDLVQNTLYILKGAFETHFIAVKCDVDKNYKCYGYPEELEQVLLTILNNAKDAFLSSQQREPLVQIAVKILQEGCYIRIEDNAGGIQEEHLDKVFEPYFSTKHKSQGTGLGLYMAKMIVEDGLGGTLSVCNTQEGACFEIVLNRKKNNDE